MYGEHGPSDEADDLRDGKANADPTAGTKVVADHVPVVRTVKDMLDGAAMRAMSREKVASLTTGHYRLDRLTGGMRPGFTWLFGADTSWGKSSFLISLCDENMPGATCLIVSSEDAESIYADRLMLRRSRVGGEGGLRVKASNLRDQCLDPDEMQAVLEVAKNSEKKPLFVAANGEETDGGKRTRGWPLEELLPHLSKIVRDANVKLIAFDYLQEFQTKQRFQDERLKFKAMAGMMRRFIRAHRICGIVFSQLTVTTETKIPTRHNIRECRDVANGSDVILLGFEPDADVKDKQGRVIVLAGKKCIHVDKVKNGPRGGKLEHDWDPHGACFNAVVEPKQQNLPEADPDDPRFQ